MPADGESPPAGKDEVLGSRYPTQHLSLPISFGTVFRGHGGKPSCIEEATYDLCFGVPFYRRLQKLMGNDKPNKGVV